ncbi:MAG TPA: zf-HC2 domain-containing protein [Thermoanaerobaculia bacterium]|nr:zf-HC2 domain-containing protein [Thermoanaerobaculia bacterium]
MVCDDVRRIAYFFLDGQVAADELVDLEGHLKLCPSCDGRLLLHRRLRAFVRDRLRPLTAPVSLRDRIHAALRSARA